MLYRSWLLAFFFTLISAIFIGRLFYLQILHGHDFAEEITKDRHVTQLIPARRGRILDRHGEVIVDNRNVYNLALVLDQLCLPWRSTRHQRFHLIDQKALTHFIAELSLRINIDATRIESVVLDELKRNPGVAVRFQRGQQIRHPELLAIPRTVLQLDALTSNEQQRVADIFEQRLLSHDPRRAISDEIRYQRQNDVLLLNAQQLQQLSKAIDRVMQLGSDWVSEALIPFFPQVHVNLGELNKTLEMGEWYCIDAEHIDQVIRHLAQFSNVEAERLRSIMLSSLDQMRLRDHYGQWYFAPSALTQKIKKLLPDDVRPQTLSITGLPPNRERLYIIQGDSEDEPGFLTLALNRIQANLDNLDVDWMRALFEEKTQRISAFRSGRRYRKRQIALDYQRTRQLMQQLAATLDKSGIPCTVNDAEQYITDIRRISDKEWQGLSRHHAIPFLDNIPKRLGIGLSGSGFDIPGNIADTYQNITAPLPGLRVVTTNGREYLFPRVASHMIGYLGRIDASMGREEALSLGLDPDGMRGRGGLEGRYDHILQGSTGVRFKRLNEETREYEVVEERSREPLPGQDLRTTINIQLQQHCEHALQNWYQLAVELGTANAVMKDGLRIGKNRAGMVVMDVESGAVLAMGSSPTYDLNGFNEKYQDLLKDPAQPLIDNATIANRHPGSVVKVLVAAAGLHEGVITVNDRIECRGYMALDARGNKILRDHAVGTFNVSEAIAHSSNVFFATVAARLKARRLLKWYRLFGNGREISYDIPWQRAQTLPSPDNIKRLRPREPHWNPYDTWSIGIGQFIKISPLEAITIPAFVANGGTIIKPHLVPPAEPVISDYVKIKPSHLTALRKGMEMAVSEGTVPYLRLGGAGSGIGVAAKTGTSQWGPRGNEFDHAWLIGYTPLENPKICFAIFVHAGTSGGRACAGVAKTVLEKYYDIYGQQGHRR